MYAYPAIPHVVSHEFFIIQASAVYPTNTTAWLTAAPGLHERVPDE